MGKRLRGGRRLGAPLFFLACCFLLTLLLTRSYAISSDEGYTLNGAWQVWNGMKMYDDFRQFVGPGSSYSIYLLWCVVGNASALAARLLSLIFGFASIVAVFLTLRRLGVRGVGLALAVFAWMCASSLYVPLNHNSFSSAAATWFLLAFLGVARPPDPGRDGEARNGRQRLADHALVGALAGVVFLFLQTKGLFLFFGAVAFAFAVGWPKRDVRAGLTVTGGFTVVVAPLFVLWKPAVLIREWFIVPLTGNYLGHTGASGDIAFIGVAVLCVMGWLAIRRGDRTLQALAVTQAALLACMSHNMELHHLAINVFPAIVFFAVVLQERLDRDRREERLSSEVTMAIVVAVFVATLLATPTGRVFFASSSFDVDLLGRRSNATLFSSPRVVAAHGIYAGPFLPGLYFEMRKKNPYFVSETIVCNDACQERLVAELSVTKPELAFLHYDMVRHLGYDQNSPVDVYLRRRYVLCGGDNHGGLIVRAIDASWCP
jgi:hypothetical protein